MANTYTLISSVTVGAGGAASIDFTSIPATYTDLVLKVSSRSSGTSVGNLYATFNGSSSSYSSKYLQGSGTGTASGNGPSTFLGFGIVNTSSQTSNTFASTDIYVPNYAGSTNKSLSVDGVSENNASDAYARLVADLWSNTSAITSISITPESGYGNFVQYSTAYLYGIKNS
jgi:hypothetical protein